MKVKFIMNCIGYNPKSVKNAENYMRFFEELFLKYESKDELMFQLNLIDPGTGVYDRMVGKKIPGVFINVFNRKIVKSTNRNARAILYQLYEPADILFILDDDFVIVNKDKYMYAVSEAIEDFRKDYKLGYIKFSSRNIEDEFSKLDTVGHLWTAGGIVIRDEGQAFPDYLWDEDFFMDDWVLIINSIKESNRVKTYSGTGLLHDTNSASTSKNEVKKHLSNKMILFIADVLHLNDDSVYNAAKDGFTDDFIQWLQDKVYLTYDVK